MNRREFLKTSALGAAYAAIGGARLTAADARTKRPNILFCISDDQSWLHTSIGGDPVVKTPHFDRVAREGVRFTNAYTACPSCAPSRAAVLTGQNFWRLEEGGLLFGRLPKKFPVYTQLLAEAGYTVGMTGKGYVPANQNLGDVHKQPCGKPWNKSMKEKPPKGVSNRDYAGAFDDFMKARDKSRPFSFWFGCFEPHRTYGYRNGEKSGLDLTKVAVPPFLPDSTEVRNDVADYLFEIQWFDAHLGRMLKTLEDHGELDNTIVVVTSDNGMPFPRAKATVYNYGVHMPLAIRWARGMTKPGRVVTDFVNHVDFAPTFLAAAGVEAPAQMTGKSLLNILASPKSGQVDEARTSTVTGLERHVWARPDGVTYPRRVIHTKDFTYIRNYEPDRWPMGGPDFKASHQGTYGDIDSGPTKSFMMANKDDPKFKGLFAKSFNKLPAEELYAIDKDPAQMTNLAASPEYQKVKAALRKTMDDYLKATKDPRVEGKSPWDDYPFYAGNKYLKGDYLKEAQGGRKKN